MERIFEQVAASFARLDFGAENERIATLKGEIGDIEAAIEAADERRTAIGRQLADYARPDGEAVAAALLERRPATDAAAAGQSRDELQAERAALSSGIGDLNRRADEARAEIAQVQQRAIERTKADADRVAAQLLAEAEAAAEKLVAAYAGLDALAWALRTGGGPALKARNAVRGILGMDRLLNYRRKLAVPSEVQHVLRQLDGKGAALPMRVPTEVSAP